MTKPRLIANSANLNSISGDRLVNASVSGDKLELGAINSSSVGFIQEGTGAVQRSVFDKLEEVVFPEDFGAVGDGVTDDALAFNRALQYCSDTGTQFKARGGSVYRIATGYSVNRTTPSAKPLLIDLNNAVVIADEATAFTFNGLQSIYLTTTFSVFPVRGDTKLALNSTENINKGDILKIISPAVFSGSVGAYHVYLVSEVIGQDVYIEGSVQADINPSQITTPNSLPSFWPTTLQVQAIRVAPKLSIQNGIIKIINSTGGGRFGILANGGYQVDVTNIDFEGRTRVQLETRGAVGYLNVTNCSFKDFGYLFADTGYVNTSAAPNGQSFGYGVLTSRTCFATIRNCVGYRGWHTVDFSRGTMVGIVSDCVFTRNAFAVSCHESAWSMYVMNCTFEGTPNGDGGITFARCAYGYAEGCFFRNFGRGHGIVYSGNMMEVIIKNCYFDYKQNTSTTKAAIYRASGGSPNLGLVSQGYERIFEVSGCTVHGPCACDAGFGTSQPPGNLTVRNNTFIKAAPTISAMSITNVRDCHSHRPSQIAFRIGSATNSSMILERLSHDGSADVTANSALIGLTGSPSKLIVKDCNGSLSYLMRFFSEATVFSVYNSITADRLFLSNGPFTATVKNVVNCGFGRAGSVGPLNIENSTNNTLLS
jgi:hypothetical protein